MSEADALPFFVRALYPFTSEEASGLSFDRGEIIEVLACLESGWWNGVCKSSRGWFPSNYVEHVPPEQVQLAHQTLPAHPPTPTTPGAAAAQPQQQQQQQQQQQADVGPIASMASSMDPPILTASANESVYRRGSIPAADGAHGVASAVPQRLRAGRRGSAPFAAEQDAAMAAAAAAVVRARAGSEGSLVSTAAASAPLSDAARVPQWESRATLDGRTYYCNIFTDQTAWAIPGDPAAGPHTPSGALELISDEATLVCMSLVRQRRDDGRGAAGRGTLAALVGEQPAVGTWEQLAARVTLAAFSLAASVGAQAKHEYMPLVLQIITSVKRLLLASASGGPAHDGPVFRTHRLLRDGHRAITQHVCALVLSARVAATVWPPPDAAATVHADIAGLVRAVRMFIASADAAGIAAAAELTVADDTVALLPGIDDDLRGAAKPASSRGSASRRLSTLQRNEYTGATVLVRDDGATAPAESLFAKDRTGIRQRLRQHLADHHQRSSAKAVAAAATTAAGPAPPAPSSPAHDDAAAAQPATAASADVLQQLDDGSRELARVILAFDRYLRKIERFYADEPPAAAAAVRAAADARLVTYAKHLVAALAVLLQVLDDLDPYGSAVVTAAIGDDPASAHAGPAAAALAAMDSLRALRVHVNDGVGALVAAAQDFADSASAAADAADADADAGPQAAPVLDALARVGDALQTLNHSTMALHIGAKRVVEACDVCDLRGLWLRVSSLHSAPALLASVPGGLSALRPAGAAGAAPLLRLGCRRSTSLPHLRRHPAIAGAAAAAVRPRADTVDDSSALPAHLARRLAGGEGSYSGSDVDDEAAGRSQTQRDTRAKDKLSRFFGDDPTHPAQARRAPHLDELSITPVGSHQSAMGRTQSRVPEDHPAAANGPPSVMSSRSSGKAVSSAAPDQAPWYLNYDAAPEEMLLSSDGQVKGSTLAALIERLAAHDVSDPNFVSTFLLTYHSFTTTPELFEGLFKRFLIQPPASLNDAELDDWTERKLKPVRLRVYNLFKTWLEQHYVEQVEGDPLGLEMLREFACTTMADYMTNAAEQLVRLIDKRRASQGGLRKMVPNLPNAAPPPLLPRSLSRLRLMDINPQELARQFTLIDSNLFNKVRPIECLKTAWSRKPGDPKAFNGLTTEIAVNVKAMSTLSTQTTLWVTANILLEHEIKRRAAVIKYFISFAEHCRNLNNFNTLMSVLGALTSVPVERLTRTWQAVQQKAMVVYNQLRQIMRTDRNFAEYRDSLHSCNPPAIPFVGVYLQDLTFIEDGNDDMIAGPPRLINFAKRQRTAGTVRDLQQFQNVPYNLTPVAEIQDWLLKRLEELCPNGQSSDRLVEEFWKMSTTLEPKEKDSERVLRLLKESGFL